MKSEAVYSGLGDRHQQNPSTGSGTGVNYTLDLNAGLTQVLADGTNTYLYGNGRISQFPIPDSQSPEYFLGDALGSVRQLAAPAGAVTLTQSYAPYGEITQSVGTSQTDYAFTGEASDENGLTFLRARYYAPQDGRFISRDTWRGDDNRPMSFNLWLYAYSNSINFTDPSGYSARSDVECAKRYVSSYTTGQGNVIRDAMNTYTAAGIATQCWAQIYDFKNRGDDNAGFGPAKISNNQASTEYGTRIGPRDHNRGFGLRCWLEKKAGVELCSPLCWTREEMTKEYGGNFEEFYELEPIHDQRDPSWVAIFMRRRIEMVINDCKGFDGQGNPFRCDEKDKFIIAALAQNGPGFTRIDISDIKDNYVRNERIQWGKFFFSRDRDDTADQLSRFYKRAKLLHNDGYWLPSNLLSNSTLNYLLLGWYDAADRVH